MPLSPLNSFRAIPQEDHASFLQTGAALLGFPIPESLNVNDVIAFFDTQVDLLESPLWLESIRKFEPIKAALGGVTK